MDPIWLSYGNLVFAFGALATAAAALGRVAREGRALAEARADVENAAARVTEDSVRDLIEDEISALDLEAVVRREVRKAFDGSEFRKRVEDLIADKVSRAIAGGVKEELDEHCKAVSKYIETEVVPRALEARARDAEPAAVAV